jgi:hypothetical protein
MSLHEAVNRVFETQNLLVETSCRDVLGVARRLSDKRVESGARERDVAEDFRLVRPELKRVLVLKWREKLGSV